MGMGQSAPVVRRQSSGSMSWRSPGSPTPATLVTVCWLSLHGGRMAPRFVFTHAQTSLPCCCTWTVQAQTTKGTLHAGHHGRLVVGGPLTKAECRLCPRLGAERCSRIDLGVLATADGLNDLHDIVTNIEAEAALQSFDLSQHQELELSQGDLFPWVLWVHHQEAIMAEI